MFAQRLKELRKGRGLTQTQFAQKFNVSNGAVGMWETGKREPDIDTINRLANFFHVSIDYLLGKSNFRNAHEMIDSWGIMGPYFEANFDFGGLVRQEREKQGISLAEMAIGLGITVQDAADCEEGTLPINHDLANRMAEFLGTNVSQMLFDNDLYPGEVPEEYHDHVDEWERLCEATEQEATREAAENRPAVLPSSATRIDFSKYHQIPILGRISAGLPLYADEHIEGYTLTDLNGGAEYFALRVYGDSMNALRICDGDIIIVRRQDEVEQGEIAVVLVDGDDATVKRFYSSNTTVTLMPQSTNPEHKPQMYDLSKTAIRVLGKVVKLEISFY